MPIYVYRCYYHGNSEHLLSHDAAPQLLLCGHEGCDMLAHKVPTAAHVRFKGSGFYQTDYKDKEVQR